MAAPTRGMLGGRLDEAAAGAAEENRRREVLLLQLFDAAATGRDASNLEDWPLQRVAARSRNLMVDYYLSREMG